MKFKKMAAVALAGVTACATVPAAVPVFAADDMIMKQSKTQETSQSQ